LFAREKFLNYESCCFRRRLNTNGPSYHLIDRSRARGTVDSRSAAGSSIQFSSERVAEPSFKELRNNKQIGPGIGIVSIQRSGDSGGKPLFLTCSILCAFVPFCGSSRMNRRAVTLSRARTCLCRFHFTIAWRRSRYQRVEQFCRRLRHLLDRAV